MPCEYGEACQVGDDATDNGSSLLTCSTNPSHVIHLACWARWTHALNWSRDEAAHCPIGRCTGVATHPYSTDPDAVNQEIVAAAAELGIYFREPVASDLSALDQLSALLESMAEPPTSEDAWSQSSENASSQSSEDEPGEEHASFPTKCLICYNDFEMVFGDYAQESTWWCSGLAQDRINAYCAQCAGSEAIGWICMVCRVYVLARASLTQDPVPQLKQFAKSVLIDGCEGSGVPQEGMLCYAAATATAVLWGTGRQLTIWECMHEFLTSDYVHSEAMDVALEYRQAIATIRSSPVFASMSIQAIHQAQFWKMDPYLAIRNRAKAQFGMPIFQNLGVAVQAYAGGITPQAVYAALRAGKPIMKGVGFHWTVIYGAFGDSDNSISQICTYDPMSNRDATIGWDSEGDYFVVG